VPDIVVPETLPVYAIVCEPSTAPKVIWPPLSVPLIVPVVMQRVPWMSMVPDSCEPICVNWIVNVPLPPGGFVVAYVPFHVPVSVSATVGAEVGDVPVGPGVVELPDGDGVSLLHAANSARPSTAIATRSVIEYLMFVIPPRVETQDIVGELGGSADHRDLPGREGEVAKSFELTA
jgi:hypothetical protein